MKRYIRSNTLPEYYKHTDYRFKVGDEVFVREVAGKPYNIRGVISDIYNNVLYIVPKVEYVENNIYGYLFTYDIDLDTEGLWIDLISPTDHICRIQDLRNGENDEDDEDDI